jgi:predicted Fe-Mo cluster-binding NifX family protein
LVDLRQVPAPDASVNRWDAIAELIPDCSVLLVGGLGRAPYERLRSRGVWVESVAGNIREIAKALSATGEIPREALRMNECGAGVSCSGRGR